MGNKKNNKKLKILLSTIVIFYAFFGNIQTVPAAFNPDTKIYSEGVFMINTATDMVVYQKKHTEKFFPASTTKIMTALITIENIPNLDEFVDIPALVMDEFSSSDLNKYGPSHADIRPGQTNVTYRDCLYALMIVSACEAANILAYNVGGGDMSKFVDMMNEKALELGCKNTNFGNPHGLHQEDNYSTPYDMYLITKYVYENYPEFMDICSAYEYDMPPNSNNPGGYTIFTTNLLLNPTSDYYYEYAKGVKTGSIDLYYDLISGEAAEGHASLVSIAERNGYTYILVTMGAPYYDTDGTETKGNYHFKDHLALYNWAFDYFEYKTVLTKNDIVATMPVLQGENSDTIQLKPMDDYFTLLPKEVNESAIQRRINTDKEAINAPVEKGEILGSVELRLADETLVTVQLVAADSVQKSAVAEFTDNVRKVLDQTWLKAGLIVLAILLITLMVVGTVIKSKNSKNKNRRIKR
ncbi:MAG: D-alanyl-D-alanine carboxypeptidase [Eubacterium sp.]|jgi:D-alanyl-D-alanine carboxypeptidase (penicillin-binding protein 5/6)|nr:D-alanyl-D-alanine carboxypeptidase [Eubacterium sp.]